MCSNTELIEFIANKENVSNYKRRERYGDKEFDAWFRKKAYWKDWDVLVKKYLTDIKKVEKDFNDELKKSDNVFKIELRWLRNIVSQWMVFTNQQIWDYAKEWFIPPTATDIDKLRIWRINPDAKSSQKVDFYESFDPRDWWLSDYSKHQNFNSAFWQAVKNWETEFVFNGKRYSTEQSIIYKKYPNLNILKWKIFVRDLWTPIVNEYLDLLNKLDHRILKKISDFWTKFLISNSPVPTRDKRRMLANVHPRWYPDWETRINVSSQMALLINSVIIWNDFEGTELNRANYCLFHELWHALWYDLWVTYWFWNNWKLKKYHEFFFPKLDEYLKQWNPWNSAWLSEFRADSVADILMVEKKDFIKKYNESYYSFVYKLIYE